MYFVVQYNWISNVLTDMRSVGFFKSLKKAKWYVLNKMPFINSTITIAIVKIKEGGNADLEPSIEVYDWSEYLGRYIPVRLDDARRRHLIYYGNPCER